MVDLPFQPVIIVGAGRSGTNMLRDALTRLDGFETWPCDEIQPIWRHGNLSHPTDALGVEHATPQVRNFIRNAFLKIWKSLGRPAVVVEKTCANTLRVPFVSAVLPEAKFISISRHGADVVSSAKLRWEGKLEIPALSYFAAKARYIPASDLPTVAFNFVKNRVQKRFEHPTRLRTWGPIWDGLVNVQGAPLAEICAHQWVACSSAARHDLSLCPVGNVAHTAYETFLGDPVTELMALCASIGRPIRLDQAQAATALVQGKAIDLGPRRGQDAVVNEILANECNALGYGV